MKGLNSRLVTLLLRQEGFFPAASTDEFAGEYSVDLCIPLLMCFCSFFSFFWQTKDLPVQSERPSYPPPVFLSPCANYGSCGLVLHYQDPHVHAASHRAREQRQQHSVRFPPSPISQGRRFFSQRVEDGRITWCYQCCPHRRPNLLLPSWFLVPDQDFVLLLERAPALEQSCCSLCSLSCLTVCPKMFICSW